MKCRRGKPVKLDWIDGTWDSILTKLNYEIDMKILSAPRPSINELDVVRG